MSTLWPELESGEAGPLYGVFGEEDFLVGQVVARFLGARSFSENPSLNIERFHAGETGPGRVLESARTLPFLGRRRLVVVQEVHLYKAASSEQFIPYLNDPAPSTCLLFAGQAPDGRTKFFRALKDAAKVHQFARMYPRQVEAWLKERAQIRDRRLAPAAAVRLAELAGLGLGALDGELEKCALYVGARREIALNDVQAVAGQGRLYSIFDFTDALAAGDLARALSAWDQLDALSEPPVRVLAMVVRLLRQLLQARAVLDEGGGEKEVIAALRIPPRSARTLYERAQRESGRQLAAHLSRVLEADLALKSSPGSNRVIMERLVMDLCG